MSHNPFNIIFNIIFKVLIYLWYLHCTNTNTCVKGLSLKLSCLHAYLSCYLFPSSSQCMIRKCLTGNNSFPYIMINVVTVLLSSTKLYYYFHYSLLLPVDGIYNAFTSLCVNCIILKNVYASLAEKTMCTPIWKLVTSCTIYLFIPIRFIMLYFIKNIL